MLSVRKLQLESEYPIVGCELTPKLLLRLPNKTTFTADVPESAPIDGQFLSYKWYRVKETSENVINCHVHPPVPYTYQCPYCATRKGLVEKSYHCSINCFQDAWPAHKDAHEQSKKSGKEEMITTYGSTFYTKKWAVGNSRTYTPTNADVGCRLMLECAVISAENQRLLGPVSTISTSCCVVQCPTPTPRSMVSVSGSFTVLTYNILSDTSASSRDDGYCQPWARSWTQRRVILLQEIVGYDADIVCLQEVQIFHCHEFFTPELEKHGYNVCYTPRSNMLESRTGNTVDGCATFYKRDRFGLVLQSNFDFNTKAREMFDFVTSDHLIEDNVALIIVLEAKFGSQICVANTQLVLRYKFRDVRLWQVHTLLKRMEEIAKSYKDVPMVICGDFNMIPGSAPHLLVVTGKLDPSHEDLKFEYYEGQRITPAKLAHKLPLVSAYSAFSRLPMDVRFDKHKMNIDSTSKEPLFTKCSKVFTGCRDYIFYTANNLSVEGLLELVEQTQVEKNEAVSSLQWPSSHIALLAQFRCIPLLPNRI